MGSKEGWGKEASRGGHANKTVIEVGVPISDAKASPDGSKIAVAGRDGVLRVLSIESGLVLGGCRSHFGSLLCCAWSPDGQVVAAGGQDDLVMVYSLSERAVIAWGEGHSGWVSGLVFDMHYQPPEGMMAYRLLSIGQDCNLALWDVPLGEDVADEVARLVSAVGSPSPSSNIFPPVPRKHMNMMRPQVITKASALDRFADCAQTETRPGRHVSRSPDKRPTVFAGRN